MVCVPHRCFLNYNRRAPHPVRPAGRVSLHMWPKTCQWAQGETPETRVNFREVAPHSLIDIGAGYGGNLAITFISEGLGTK